MGHFRAVVRPFGFVEEVQEDAIPIVSMVASRNSNSIVPFIWKVLNVLADVPR